MRLTNQYFFLVLFTFSAPYLYGQLQFCGGNSGDPIFIETFGSGLQDGPALPAGTTTYNYVNGGPQQPADGNYTISSRTNYFDWFDTTDHTPGDVNGKAFIVNADFTPGEFFRRTIDGLCENTSYEFSSWLLNLLPSSTQCPNGGIPINVRFQIWDDTDSVLLATGDTGNLQGTSNPIWRPYGLVFQTEPGQTSVILKMLNNGAGGCGNDLAIDDIVFKSCGDFIEIKDAENESLTALCVDSTPATVTLTATPDFSVFGTHFYQWQESIDATNWTDIPGETSSVLLTNAIDQTRFYRVKVAEDIMNVSNLFCNVISDVFEVLIVPIPDPPIIISDTEFCENENPKITVEVAENETVNWYDAPINGNLLLADSLEFVPATSGLYYAEARSTLTTCIATSRTEIEVEIFDAPVLFDEEIEFCEGESVVLSADFENATYLWSTGEGTEVITINEPGVYSVKVTNAQLCSNTKTFVVNQIDAPIIDMISSSDENIIVDLLIEGVFEFSLDGITYNESPIFDLIQGGRYTIYVRSGALCPPITQEFLHIVIPKFFTPNGDTINDSFKPQGVEFANRYEISIFNRYGKLLVSSTNKAYSWDGSLNGRPLPASDYWYTITIDDSSVTGHLTLKKVNQTSNLYSSYRLLFYFYVLKPRYGPIH